MVWTRFSVACVAIASLAVQANAQEISREAAVIDTAAAHDAFIENQDRDPGGFAKVRAAEPQGVDEVVPPVMLLGTGEVRAAPEFRQQVTSYVALYDVGEALLSVMGAAAALVPGDGDAILPLLTEARLTDFVFEPADDGEDSDAADLSFTRFGASYVLRLACDLLTDERCQKSEFLERVATSLLVFGGKGVK